MKVKVTFVRMYKKAGTGKTVFVYEVTGSKAGVEKYSEAKGDNLVIGDNGNPLWFTTNSVGKTGELVITDDGKTYVDQSELEMVASQVAQLGGNLGTAMAEAYAAKMVNSGNSSTAVSNSVKTGEGADLNK